MTQAKAPREFKFVGAFSRKHQRRRGANKPVTTDAKPSRMNAPATSPSSLAAAAAAGEYTASDPTSHRHQADDRAAANVLMGMQIDAGETDADMIQPQTTNMPAPVPDMSNINGLGDNTGLPAEVPNCYFDPPLNLFTDFDASFSFPLDPSTWYYKIPFLPDPNGVAPFDQLGDSPSTEASSARTHLHAHHEDETTMDGEALQMPPLDRPEAIPLPASDVDGPRGSISHTISQLLTRYDEEFCVLPLTHDFEANPFRFDSKTGRGSQLLLHCILAVCYKHISRDTGAYGQEAKSHKRKAFELLRDVENHASNPVHANFLDALLILMTLDCATSARGPWIWYLQRAHKMIHATASNGIQETPRIQARIEMLVWWDVTLALTSRQGCVLSEATTMSLLSPAKEGGNATFFSISGCPRDLFEYMVRLAAYAREFEVVNNMTCVLFDMSHIADVCRGIKAWGNPKVDGGEESAEDAKSVAALQNSEDLHHCAEAWRNALLVYIERVFHRGQGGPPSPMLEFFSRRTFNHVAACRRSSMVQKQLLLPVFLAGCETTDDSLREQAREYCRWWDERTRYGMFSTATGLLEEIWASDDPSLWWGAVLDQKARENGSSQVPSQYLFG